mmetsp:Transcript_22595/g.64203  ORF Transcript_22595/g.64203 Transcript_22595/m.64203 type:complete len:622 (+) Transcript_22595:737-2602(+)
MGQDLLPILVDSRKRCRGLAEHQEHVALLHPVVRVQALLHGLEDAALPLRVALQQVGVGRHGYLARVVLLGVVVVAVERRIVLAGLGVRRLVHAELDHVRHHLAQEHPEDLGLPLAAAPDALGEHDGPAVVEVQKLKSWRLQVDEEPDEVAAEQRVRVGGEDPGADHLRHEGGGRGRRRGGEPQTLLLVKAGADALGAVGLLQLLLLELGDDLLEAVHLLLQVLVLAGVVPVALVLQLLLLLLHELNLLVQALDGLLVAGRRHGNVLQGESPEGRVEEQRQSFGLEVRRQVEAYHFLDLLQLRGGLHDRLCGGHGGTVRGGHDGVGRGRGLLAGLGDGNAIRWQSVAHRHEGKRRLEDGEDGAQRRQQRHVLLAAAGLGEELGDLQEALVVPVEQEAEELRAPRAAVRLGEALRQEVVPLLAQRVPQHRDEVQVDQGGEEGLPGAVLAGRVLLLPHRDGLGLQPGTAREARQLLRVHVGHREVAAHVLYEALEDNPDQGLALVLRDHPRARPAVGYHLAVDAFRDDLQQPVHVRVGVLLVEAAHELAQVAQPGGQHGVGLVQELPRFRQRPVAASGEDETHHVRGQLRAARRALHIRLEHVDVEADLHVLEHHLEDGDRVR